MTENSKPKQESQAVKILKAMASLKVTVVCLLVLTVLVIWGTLYQADNGLYQAQQKFFHSIFFLALGFIPLPGTVLTMFVLFVNLVCALFFRIGFRWSNLGNLVTHLGIIVLLVGSFFTFYYSQESSLMMREGESSHMSSSRQAWELAVWEETGGERDVYALDTETFDAGVQTGVSDLGLTITIRTYYRNCQAFTRQQDGDDSFINGSGIGFVKERPLAMEAGENTEGGIFDVTAQDCGAQALLLYGRETVPTTITCGKRRFSFALRRQKIPLPLTLILKDFRMKYYPNSQIPKSYESTVTISTDDGVERDVVISMNKPLRHAGYTFFQSSYYIANDGSEYSILAVVKNSGRLLPYFSSIIIFMGMLIHFLVMLWKRRKKAAVQNPNSGEQS